MCKQTKPELLAVWYFYQDTRCLERGMLLLPAFRKRLCVQKRLVHSLWECCVSQHKTASVLEYSPILWNFCWAGRFLVKGHFQNFPGHDDQLSQIFLGVAGFHTVDIRAVNNFQSGNHTVQLYELAFSEAFSILRIWAAIIYLTYTSCTISKLLDFFQCTIYLFAALDNI